MCAGQITTSPSSRGTLAGRAGSTPSIGNDSTSVGPALPRWRAFSSAIRSASTNSTATWPSLTPRRAAASAHSRSHLARAAARSGARLRAEAPRPRASPLRRCGSRGAAAGRRSGGLALGVLVVGLDDPLHELVAHDVLAAEADELDVLDRVEHVADDDQPGLLLARQVDLRDVAGDDHPRAEAEPREEHLHLLGRRVLRLVEDHERVVERASAHERQRRDLDHAALDVLGDLLRVEHVVQRVEQRAQVGVDLRHQVARQEAEPLAGLDRGAREDDAVDLVARRARRRPSRPRGRSCRCPAGPDAEGDRAACGSSRRSASG